MGRSDPPDATRPPAGRPSAGPRPPARPSPGRRGGGGAAPGIPDPAGPGARAAARIAGEGDPLGTRATAADHATETPDVLFGTSRPGPAGPRTRRSFPHGKRFA